MVRVVLIDKHLTSRKCLLKKLALFEEIEVVGEASSAQQGIELIHKTTPNLVFIGVEAPDRDEFQMLKKLSEIDFEIIFMSSDASYALEAIKNKALDYLLKPIHSDALEQAIESYKEKTENQQLSKVRQVKQKMNSLYDHPSKKILLAIPKGYKMMNVDDIIYCKSSGRYIIIYPYGETPIVITQSLRSFENKFSMYGYIRIHDSYIINIQYLDTYKNGEVHLIDGTKLKVSRTRRSELLAILKGFKLVSL
jgi:two-component system LytT family response regulator